MCESVEVLVVIDDKNKIYYTEEKTFAAGSESANLARLEYLDLLKKATINGYQIIKREKSFDSMDGGTISEIDETVRRSR